MRRNNGAVLLLVVVVLVLALLVRPQNKARFDFTCEESGSLQVSKTEDPADSLYGEELTFNVYCKGIKVGTSVLTFNGVSVLDGKDCYYITFNTKVVGFRDFEQIYALKGSFLPLKVVRKIKKFGFSSDITEIYDQDSYSVAITNKSRSKTTEMVINSDAPIANAILLPYVFRMKEGVMLGADESFKVNLPTAAFEIVAKDKEDIQTPLGSFTAKAFKSVPKKFSFWLSDDQSRLPIKIEDYTSFGYSMELVSIENREF